jgi:hypothetical protein
MPIKITGESFSRWLKLEIINLRLLQPSKVCALVIRRGILAFFHLPPTSCYLTTSLISYKPANFSARSLPSSSYSTSKPCLSALLKLSSLPLILDLAVFSLCQFSTRQVLATVPTTSKRNSLRSPLMKKQKTWTGNCAMRNLSLS